MPDGCGSFIGITSGLVFKIADNATMLSQHPRLLDVLELEVVKDKRNNLQALFFYILFNFIVCHEYAHLIEDHDGALTINRSAVPQEIQIVGGGNLKSQIEECVADQTATLMVLKNLFEDDGARWLPHLAYKSGFANDGPMLLIWLFVVAVTSFFLLRFRPSRLTLSALIEATHPHPAMRIGRIMDAVVSWCAQVRPGLEACIPHAQFVLLVHATVAALNHDINRYLEQESFWTSRDGDAYRTRLRAGLGDYYRRSSVD